jgi:hypothetical protein
MSKRIKVVAVTTAFILASAGIANATPAQAPQVEPTVTASTKARADKLRAYSILKAKKRTTAHHKLALKKRAEAKRAAERKRAAARSSRSETSRSLPQGTSSSNQRLGKQMAADWGWTGDQWGCLRILWTKESGWSTTDSLGSAYGIPQALPGSKMAKAGSDWRTNPATQIEWGLGYIKGRYGSPCSAWGHFQSRNWY